ncbi:MAG: Eco57I restriction-modification methylase domain-containing protein [Kiritimatiellaeota bacterium]|nr:Eco57I restriction-modification methylase domain-containing protein [Kiritimatiellota bacterium]
MKIADPDKLRSIKTLSALIAYLRDELDWPIEADELDELTFDWSADQLLVSDSQARRLTAGVIRQLRPLTAGQPWGIFVVEFADDTFRRGALREILRGLVANRRRDPSLPAWQHENLLFICATRDYAQITFAHYRGEKAQKARLALFGWQCGSSYLRTLCEFNLPALHWPEDTADASAWLKQWASAFDKEPLTKEFFKEIASWYFWTLKNCRFPKDAPKEADGYDHISVIRLITRLIFCWFIREKGLIPDALFDEHKLAEALLGFDPGKAKNRDSVFYRAMLQNLFFATLNTEMDKRGWAKEDQNFMAHNLYRHKECFRKPGDALTLFKNIPFLNGGLFECLDKDFGENAKPRYLRIDGFSRRPDSQPVVPDFLFFGPEQEVDLSEDYNDKKFRKVRVRGLIETLNHYKFTIEENTPFDQEVALDPELCGKVFENLLAAYNPETGTTARKATGSFYTPREIVDYMVDESLVAFLKVSLTAENAEGAEKRLRRLISWEDAGHDFSEAETEKLIDAIDHLKALDPAVGSGAFPMGILHKLVHVLKKLDPRNEKWKERQIRRVRDAITTAEKIEDADIRERTIKELEAQIDGINDAFEHNELDYGRKLFLIENCIYGVDIQPIAVQIAKMRFFISLIVDQKVYLAKPNLGVRALPNLETKFVAANTLIGIHRPAQMLLRNPAIDKKETELRQVREKHFNAKTPANKAKWREQDKKLRTEIADLLKTDGWDDKTARQLAAWDPYDQNASAPFFDPEWIFGVRDGFDIVIGNPPYVSALEFARIYGDELRLQLNARYESATGAYDYFVLFVEEGLKLCKDFGHLCFITPNKYLAAMYAIGLRGWLLKHASLQELIDVSPIPVFEEVAVYPVVSLFCKDGGKTPTISVSLPCVRSLERFDIEHYMVSTVPSKWLKMLPENIWGFLLSRDVKLLPKVMRFAEPLEGFGEVNATSTAAEADEYGACLSAKPGAASMRLINTGTIDRYTPLWGTVEMTHGGRKFLTPYLPLSMAKVNARRMAMYKAPKIIFAKMAKTCEAVIDVAGEFASLNTNCFYRPNAGVSLKYVGGICNSHMFMFLYDLFFGALRMSGGYYQFQAPQLRVIPIPRANAKEQAAFEASIDRILAAKKADPSADTSALEREIDERVYRLYGLTEAEIKIVEQAGGK